MERECESGKQRLAPADQEPHFLYNDNTFLHIGRKLQDLLPGHPVGSASALLSAGGHRHGCSLSDTEKHIEPDFQKPPYERKDIQGSRTFFQDIFHHNGNSHSGHIRDYETGSCGGRDYRQGTTLRDSSVLSCLHDPQNTNFCELLLSIRFNFVSLRPGNFTDRYFGCNCNCFIKRHDC